MRGSLKSQRFSWPLIQTQSDYLVCHGITDIIDAQPNRGCRHMLWIRRIVSKLPAVAYVHIEIDGDDHAAAAIHQSPPVRNGSSTLDATTIHNVGTHYSY